MSRVYFHTPTATAELLGSERAWLRRVAEGPGTYAWGLASNELERAYWLVGASPEPDPGAYGANYLHRMMREAKTADDTYNAACRRYDDAGRPDGPLGGPRFDPEPWRRFLGALETALRVDGFPIDVAGHRLHTGDVERNTALVAGSDTVALAAKITGWCENHCWVEGPDRAWMADLIDTALDAGIYRHGLWYADTPNGPNDRWSDQGWGDVTALLRSRDDEPVVLSYSVTETFPNPGVADWTPPEFPADWRPSWADDEQSIAGWDATPDDDKAEQRIEAARESWYDLPTGEQWDRAMRGLRTDRPWARLSPDTLRTVSFGPMVTVYDLFAPDRDERVRRVFAEAVAATP